jgi:replication factor C subunit 1
MDYIIKLCILGKTTTVALVCKELGFDVVEFNASDTRSKTLIRDQISELLTTTSLSGFAKGELNI